jgi:hypothetical protein
MSDPVVIQIDDGDDVLVQVTDDPIEVSVPDDGGVTVLIPDTPANPAIIVSETEPPNPALNTVWIKVV